MIDERSPIPARYEHLRKVLLSERFRKKQGLGNEVPFFICPYLPQDDVEMKRLQKQLMQSLRVEGLQILSIDLYDLSIEMLKKRGIWDQILKIESKKTKDQIKGLLQNTLDPETHLVPAIAEKMQAERFEVLFLTGVGEVFPYLRSHNILNNLQIVAKEQPTLMFFPGAYVHTLEGGASLELFGLLQDDKYYRAFNIYHYEI
jgi:hypothetical protein